MATVSVLCTRMRVEEKQIVAALAAAGVPALPLDPSRLPLPVGPVPPGPSAGQAGGVATGVVIDRCQDRAVAAAVVSVLRSSGVAVIDAGIAATGDRLAVAARLAAAGVPRPETRLVCSEESALAALDEIGYPATLLPLSAGASEITVLDRDVAEAVLEHRSVLGAKQDAVGLVQAGMPLADERVTVIVVDGRAAGLVGSITRPALTARLVGIAEAGAQAIGTAIVGIEIALTGTGPAIWDVQAAPDFRAALPLSRRSVAEAIAELATRRCKEEGTPSRVRVEIDSSLRREVTDDVALTA